MTVSTLRPSSTVTNSGIAVNGGGTAHGALSDNSDSTYLDSFGIDDYIILGLDDLTLPSGALVKNVAARLRVAATAGMQTIEVDTLFGHSKTQVGWSTPQTITTFTQPSSALDATIDGATLTLFGGLPSSTNIRVYEAYLDVTHVAKPVPAPSAPSGTLTTTNVPTVTWANTLDSDGGPQTHYVVKVFSAAQYGAGGFDPATSTPTVSTVTVLDGADTSWTPTVVLPNATYRAYVWVAQTVNGAAHWSDPAYTGFVINATPPAVPDTPVLTAEPASGRIKVHVEGNSGSATTTHLEVQRSIDGATWEPLRLTTDTDGVIAGTSADVYDYEAPNGVTVSYRVRAHHTASDLIVASAWATTATGSWSSSAWWLKAPESPSLNMIVEPDSLPGYQRPARQGVFQPLGRPDSIIVADTARGSARGTLKLSVASRAESDDLDVLLGSGLTLLLQGPVAEDEPDRCVRFGDEDRSRWIDKGFVTERIATLAWFEVASPAGVIDAWPA